MFRLIVLSDIHFDSIGNSFVERATTVARAALTQLPLSISGIGLLWNGDLANKGQVSEFDLARQFVEAVTSQVREMAEKRGVPLISLFTPGNHDCDFSTDQEMRDLCLASLKPNRPKTSIEEAILSPLENYFYFIDSMGANCGCAIDRSNPYINTIRFDIRDKSIQFILLNSAWMSKRQEKTDEATFPLEILGTTPFVESTVSIVSMHHPLNWFRMPDTRTQLREWINSHADLLITGHEHSPRESITSSGMSTVAFCESGALHENGNLDSSHFHILDIDLDLSSACVCRWVFASEQAIYSIAQTSELALNNSNNHIQVRRFTSEHKNWLEDPMLPIQIANKNKIRLQDFFLYPDLNEYSNSVAPAEQHLIHASRVLETLVVAERCLLTGDDNSGKTALARKLIMDLHSKGKIPLYLDAKDLDSCRSQQQIEFFLAKKVKKQYVDLTYDAILQLYPTDLVLIVDDFHLLYQSSAVFNSVIKTLESLNSSLIVFASEELALLESHGIGGDFATFAGYRKFQICEFGQLRIEALAKKWLELSISGKSRKPEELQRDVVKLTKQIQNVLSADVIPHQPWILIILLQQSEDDTILVRNGSYGHMYQAIVTAALSRSKASTLELSGKFAYLGKLAYQILESGTDFITTEEARDRKSVV